jgi:hypothetical protein
VCKEVCALSHNHGSLSNVINSIRASAIKYGEMQHAGVLVQDVPSAVKFYTEVWYSNTPTPPNTNTQIQQQRTFSVRTIITFVAHKDKAAAWYEDTHILL